MTRDQHPITRSDQPAQNSHDAVLADGTTSSIQPAARTGRNVAHLKSARPASRSVSWSWTFVVVLACVLLRTASVHSIMTHQHVKDLVRLHIHRRHRAYPTPYPRQIQRCARAGPTSVLTVPTIHPP